MHKLLVVEEEISTEFFKRMEEAFNLKAIDKK